MTELSDRIIPDEVEIRHTPRKPIDDPTLGMRIDPLAESQAGHRLVTIGDSMTQGFMSAAVFRTDLSWPAMIAYELGLRLDQFRFPTYEEPDGPGGLPVDLERLSREFDRRFGSRLDFGEAFRAGLWVRSYLDEIEDYWETGEGSREPASGESFHNMGVYGWDVLDATQLNADIVGQRISRQRDRLFSQVVQDHNDRAGLVVLQRARADGRQDGSAGTVFDAAQSMATTDGIETLVVILGANNALGTVIDLTPRWTPAEYADLPPAERLTLKRERKCTVWRPSAFAADWSLLVEELRRIPAEHIIIATVPSVTIAPIARGVGVKVRPDSRYFPYYTRPWISDKDFQTRHDPYFTEDEARAVDSAIDAYNETIIESVRAARQDGLDWLLFDLGALLDQLAFKRYVKSPWAQPEWWSPYKLPPELLKLDPVPNTHFFRAGSQGRTDGGLFSLDGVHPTTIGYGLIAQEVIDIMQRAGVKFANRNNPALALATTPTPSLHTPSRELDWNRVVASDSLISAPPPSISSTLDLLGWLDERIDWVRQILPEP